MKISEDAIKGAVYGQAIGDALGLAAEYVSKREVARLYPNRSLKGGYKAIKRNKWRSQWEPGEWTDDTGQMLVILDSLLWNKGDVKEKEIAKGFVEWLKDDGRGSGGTFLDIVSSPGYLEDPKKIAYRKWVAGGRTCAPNGAVMRTSACGLLLENKTTARNTAYRVCELTHADPRCVISCILVTEAIRVHVLDRANEFDLGKEINTWFDWLEHSSLPESSFSLEDREKWRKLVATDALFELELGIDRDSYSYTLKTLGAGLWAYQHAIDFETGLLDVIYEGGDTDTNGAVAGALMGAKFGASGIPSHLIDGLNPKERLDHVIERVLSYWKSWEL